LYTKNKNLKENASLISVPVAHAHQCRSSYHHPEGSIQTRH